MIYPPNRFQRAARVLWRLLRRRPGPVPSLTRTASISASGRTNSKSRNPEALAAILEEVGADTATFRRWIEDEESEAKPRLKRGFAEAAADHVFGVPTFVVDGEIFWGYDRMPWLIQKIGRDGPAPLNKA